MGAKPPTFKAGSFDCPHCHAFTQQTWFFAEVASSRDDDHINPNVAVAECYVCRKPSIWRRYREHGASGHSIERAAMLYPSDTQEGPDPHPDLPEEVRDLFDEARSVLPSSPRAASALVRLTLEALLTGLYPDAGDLNKMIGAASADGLPEIVINAMDGPEIRGQPVGSRNHVR